MSVIGDITRALICAAAWTSPDRRRSSLVSKSASPHGCRGNNRRLDQWAKFDRTRDPQDEPYFIIGHKIFGLPARQARAPGKTGDLAFGFRADSAPGRNCADGDTSTKEEVEQRKQAWRNAHRAPCGFGTISTARRSGGAQPANE